MVLYSIVFYCILLFSIVFYCFLLYFIVFYCILLFSIVFYCFSGVTTTSDSNFLNPLFSTSVPSPANPEISSTSSSSAVATATAAAANQDADDITAATATPSWNIDGLVSRDRMIDRTCQLIVRSLNL